MRGVESQGMLCSADGTRHLRRCIGPPAARPTMRRSAPTCAQALDARRFAADAEAHAESRRLPVARRHRARGRARSPRRRVTPPPPRADRESTGDGARDVRVEDPLACPRFCARVIEGIDPRAPTPAWMKQRLERSGIRPISAVVDVTNYVMLELGQPLHAYDDALLEGDIVVRFPRDGEQAHAAQRPGARTRARLLLVGDEQKPLGLAGIMGGEHQRHQRHDDDRVPRRRVLESGGDPGQGATPRLRHRCRLSLRARRRFPGVAGRRRSRDCADPRDCAAAAPGPLDRRLRRICRGATRFACAARASRAFSASPFPPDDDRRDLHAARAEAYSATATISSSRRRRTASTSRSRRT